MDTLEAGLHENAPLLVAQHKRGTSKLKHPSYTPKLRNWQTLQGGHGRNTVARTLWPFGHSETRVEIITKNGFPTIRILTIRGAGRNHHLDLRKSGIRAVINGLHIAATDLGGL